MIAKNKNWNSLVENFVSEFEQFGTDFEVYLLEVIFKNLSHVRQRI